MQPLANIRLKMDQFGSDVEKKNVTPAEVLLLVADFHPYAGGDPIKTLKQVPEKAELERLAELQADIEQLTKRHAETVDLLDITEEVREKRLESFRTRITSLQSQLDDLRVINGRRKLDSIQEKQRLIFSYGRKKVERIFPGSSPNLPTDFDSAKRAGLEVSKDTDQNIFVTS